MTREELDNEILKILKDKGANLTIYIKRRVNYKAKNISVQRVRNRLKKLEKEGKVETASSVYKTQLKWRIIKIDQRKTKTSSS